MKVPLLEVKRPLLESLVIPGWGLRRLGRKREALVILLGAVLALPFGIVVSALFWLYGLL